MARGVAGTSRCGTPSGFDRHQRNKERPCNACYRAKAEYDVRRRSSTEQVRLARLRARAQQRASTMLKRLYPEEYREMYLTALEELTEMDERLYGGKE